MTENLQKIAPTKSITVRCYAELNDFLPTLRKQKPFILELKTPVTLAEAVESIGIPLSEVDLALVNSEPAERSFKLTEGDYVSLYPVFETFDIAELKSSKSPPLRVTRFILDAHLGKLAKYLRMLGFDTLYRNDFGDAEIIEIALKENRIILTRDKLLLKPEEVTHAYYVRATEKHEQLQEVVRKFDLVSQFESFTRCMTCNSELQKVSETSIAHLLEIEIAAAFDEFFLCSNCQKVYWKGSHFERMEQLILSLAST